jgi:hypothetical protein
MTRDGVAILLNPQAQNSYSYGQNNPIVQKDPSGRQAINFGGGFTFKTSDRPGAVGPMGGIIFAKDGIYVYSGGSVSLRPGPSGAVTFSSSNPNEGEGTSVSAYGIGGVVGGQWSLQTVEGRQQLSTEVGLGLPGASWDSYKITYIGSYEDAINLLGGPHEYVTTPSLPETTIANSQQKSSSPVYRAPQNTQNQPSNSSWFKNQVNAIQNQINKAKDMMSQFKAKRD